MYLSKQNIVLQNPGEISKHNLFIC